MSDTRGSSPTEWREAPRAKALRLLQGWIKTGVLPAGSALPSERQLASKMDVGLATVQRALRVLDGEGIISRKGYTRIVGNSMSHSLLTNVVAVLAGPGTPSDTVSEKPFGGKAGYLGCIATGAMSAIQKKGFHAISLQPANLAGEQLESLLLQRPLGVVIPEIVGHIDSFPDLFKTLVKSKVPFVAGGDYAGIQGYDHVYSDHEFGAYQIAKWLISQGRLRILCVLPSQSIFWVTARYKGYCRAMREANLEPLPVLSDETSNLNFSEDETRFRVKSLYFTGRLIPFFKEGRTLDAIMATNDNQACEVQAACTGLEGTSEVRSWVTGYDNFHEYLKDFRIEHDLPIPAATVDKRNFELGRELVGLLLDRVNGSLPKEPQARNIEPLFTPLRS